MKSKYLLAAALTVLLCAGSARPSAPQEADSLVAADDPLVLSKIKSVVLLVQKLGPDAQFDGLKQEAIQTDIELKLRTAGIPISTPTPTEQLRDHTPSLHVALKLVKWGSGFYIHNIEVELIEWEPFSSARTPHLKVMGVSTWRKSNIGITAVSNLKTLRDVIKDQVDIFYNDYLKANPKN